MSKNSKRLVITKVPRIIIFLGLLAIVLLLWFFVRAPVASDEVATEQFVDDFDSRNAGSIIGQGDWFSTGVGTAEWVVTDVVPPGIGQMLSQTSFTANIANGVITNSSSGMLTDSEVVVDFKLNSGSNPQIWLRRTGIGASASGYILTGPGASVRIFKSSGGVITQISTGTIMTTMDTGVWYTAAFKAVNTGNTVYLKGYIYPQGEPRPDTPTVTAIDTANTSAGGYAGLGAHAGQVDYDNFAVYSLQDVPEKPTILTAVGKNSRVDLTWTEPENNGAEITDYLIEYGVDGSFEEFSHLESNATSITVTELDNDTAYDFRISAINEIGTSVPSSEVAVTPALANIPSDKLKLWLKADAGVYQSAGGSASENGEVVGQWQDVSGNGRHTVQPFTSPDKRPKLYTGAINGQPVVRFDGINDYLTNTSTAIWKFLHDTTGFSTFFVMKTADANPQTLLTLYNTGGEVGTEIGSTLAIDDVLFNNGFYSPIVNGSAPYPKDRGTGSNLVTMQTPNLVATTYLYGGSGNDFNLYVNGDKVDTQESAAAPASGNSTYNLSLGAMSNGAKYFFKGDIAEALMFNEALTPGIRQQVECYLADKYGLALDIDCTLFVPSAVIDLSGSASNTQAALSWTDAMSNGADISDYIVHYRLQSNTDWTVYDDGISASAEATITGLTVGSTYEFRVIPQNSEGQGLPSNILTLTPFDVTPYAPTATSVSVSGSMSVGERLTGSYAYGDSNGDAEGSSIYRWLRADVASGPYVAISGADSINHRLTNDDLSKFIKFEVTPVSTAAPTNGVTALSSTMGPVTEALPIVHHILSTGQSLSLGSHGDPPLTTTQPYRNLMLSGSLLASLVEGSTGVETMSSAMANTLTALDQNGLYRSLVSIHGVGASSYIDLKKGSSPYQTGMDQINTARAAVTATSSAYEVAAVTVIHGETDHIQGTSAEQYEANLVEWQSDYETDAKAVTGQTGSIPLFTDQMGTWTTYNSATSGIPHAQLAATENNPTSIYLVGPKYFLPYADGSHLTNAGYRRLGEYYGKVMKKVLLDGEAWKPLSPETIVRNGNSIYARFHVPSGSLVFDTTSVSAKTNYGFEYFDAESSASISAVQLMNTDIVKISLSAEPTGDNQRLRYAYTGTAGVVQSRTDNRTVLGNLRDSDATPSLYDNDLYNWSVHFDKPVMLDEAAPEISSVTAAPRNTTAVVSWATDESASSIVDYGLSAENYSSTVQTDLSSTVSNHTVNLSSLTPCTSYHYRVRSKDLGQNEAIGPARSFATGCTSVPSSGGTPANITTSTPFVPGHPSIYDLFDKPTTSAGMPKEAPKESPQIKEQPEEVTPALPASPVYAFTKTLVLGVRGEDVFQLQVLLKKLGFFKYPLITGYFGPITRQAVIDFQRAYYLTPYPGWVGPKTRAILNKLLAE